MKKSKTQSVLACAVLASVLTGGFFVPIAEAAQVNAIVGPKDFSTIYGREVIFGQQRGFSSNQYESSDPNKVQVIDHKPTWQIVAADNGGMTLLAKESWGVNRYSEPGVETVFWEDYSIGQRYYSEVLQCLEEKKGAFFTPEELALLSNQTSYQECAKKNYTLRDEYNGVFALPTKQTVENLTGEQRKRSDIYWLNDAVFQKVDIPASGASYKYYYDAYTVETDGRLVEHNGNDVYNFYPMIVVQSPMFAYYGDRPSVGQSFKKQVADSSQTVHVAVKNIQTENDVQIKALEIAPDKIKFTAVNLSTGTGQGLAGVLANNEGNYVSYARLADTSVNNSVDKTITYGSNKFLDNSQFVAGNYTVCLFNEKINADTSGLDYVGNFYKLSQVSVNGSGAITKATISGNRNFANLKIAENVDFNYTSVNYAVVWNIDCEAVTFTDSLDWANVLNAEGSITLKGSFSVANDTLTLVRPTNSPTDRVNYFLNWNDITYNGGTGKTATLKVNGSMHSFIVNGGTFIAEKSLTLSGSFQAANDARAIVKGDLTAADMQLTNNAVAEFVGGKSISISNSLTMRDNAILKATGGTSNLTVSNGAVVKGSTELENINLETKDLSVEGTLNLQGNLTVKKSLNMQNDNADSITVNNFVFGEGSKSVGEYYLDLGQENFTINGKATGNVKLNFNRNCSLQDKDKIEVFTGTGDLTGLNIQPIRITERQSGKTYLLTQDTTEQGKMNVNVAKHNTAIIFADGVVVGQKVYFGNYWQSDTNGDGKVDKTDAKQKILWDVVEQKDGVTTLFSEKVLQKSAEVFSGPREDVPIEFFKDNFDYYDDNGAWMREAFSEGEAKLFGNKLDAPILEEVQEGGTFNLTEEQRRASGTAYSGVSAYGLANAYEESDPISRRKKFYLYQIDDQGKVIDNNSTSPGYGSASPGYGPVSPGIRPVPLSNSQVSLGIRPIMYFDGGKSVLFATNAENGKSSVGVGGYTRLKPVDSHSTLELTFDDAYVHSYTGQERKTGDISIDRIMLNVNSVQLQYSGAKYVDDNSYISYFVGEGNLSQDYLGYGKSEVVDKSGKGSVVVRLKDITDAKDMNGYALTVFNEYDKGTSMAGTLNVVPGSFTLDSNGNTNYTIKGNATLSNLIVGISNKFTATNGTLTITGVMDTVGTVNVEKMFFADGSTLMVDGDKVKDKAAITYTGNIQAADNSRLIINNSKEGVEYKIVEKKPQLMLMANGLGNSNSTPDLEKIVIPGYGMVLDTDGSTLSRDKVSVRFMSDPNIRKYCDLSNVITGVNRSTENLLWLKELEYKLNNSSGADRELLNNYVNTFANLNSLANVQGGLRTMSSLVNDSIQENVGLRGKDSGLGTEGQGKYDKQVWASFIHNKEKIEGRKTGHLQQNSTLQYNGVVVGADLWKSEHGFGGFALHYADGNFRDVQMITDVKNEVDYYGISVYNRQDVGKFNIICDGGFTYAKNDISWRTVEGEYVLTKPKAMAYNVGFKVEEPIKLSKATELTPFAGLRYTFIKTKDYTDNYGDRFAADNQHLVNLPIGLTLKGTYETKEGWTLGGKLTGGYSWNLGNRTDTQSIGYAIFSDSMNFDVADRGEYFVKAGLTAEHKNLAFELGYRYSKGDTVRDNRWNVNVNWSF